MTNDNLVKTVQTHAEGDTGPPSMPLSTVIASVPGVSEQSLRATLQSLPTVNIVGTATGCLSALQLVRALQADVIVIDANLPLDDVRLLLQQLKREDLPTYALVLAATNGRVRRALADGAHASLRRDSASRQLREVLDAFQLARDSRQHG